MKNIPEVPRGANPNESNAQEADEGVPAHQVGNVFDILTKRKLTPEEIDRRVEEEDKDIKEAYQQYRKLGGIINENDYRIILIRALGVPRSSETSVLQVENIAEKAGIALHDAGGATDPRTILYGILRPDTKPADVQYHHAQMSDQRLFAEVLRILGDDDSLKKLIEKYPNIPFS
jgi:hypothetical protein